MVLASSGGLRGGTSELPTAGENTSFADSQGAQPDEFGEADLAGLDTTGVDIEFEDNETFSDTELPPNDSLVDLAPSSMWSHSYHRNIKTLYHTTSPDIANRILHSSFHPGNSGWCGGAIYFVDTPYLPRSKYGPQTQSGAVIKAVVDLGRMAYMDHHCHSGFGSGMGAAARAGFNSIRFDPGDGNEYVILSSSRILYMQRYK